MLTWTRKDAQAVGQNSGRDCRASGCYEDRDVYMGKCAKHRRQYYKLRHLFRVLIALAVLIPLSLVTWGVWSLFAWLGLWVLYSLAIGAVVLTGLWAVGFLVDLMFKEH